MPVTAQPRGLLMQELRGFRGVNLYRDRLNLEDQDVARAINADLHTMLGSIVIRLGRTAQYSTGLGSAIRRLAKHNSARYEVAGNTLYRNEASISTSLDAGLTTMRAARPLNELTTWLFVANINAMLKDDTTNTLNWGIAAPGVVPTVGTSSGSSGMSGNYRYQYTYLRKESGRVLHESNPSPSSPVVAVTNTLQVDLSGLTASSDSQVTHKRIYRTQAGGSTFLFEQDIDDSFTTATSTMADGSLGGAVESDNDPPPFANYLTFWRNRAWLVGAGDNKAYYSKAFRPEAFPLLNFIELDDPSNLTIAAAVAGAELGIFTKDRKYRIVEQIAGASAVGGAVPVLGGSDTAFYAFESASKRGAESPAAVLETPLGAFFIARDGAFLTDYVSPDVPITGGLEPLFYGDLTVNSYSPINWDSADNMASAFFNGRIYWAYPSGTSQQPNIMAVYQPELGRWYHYDHSMSALYVEDDIDELMGGGVDGIVYILEDGAATGDGGSSISFEVEFADRIGGVSNTKKLFRYLKIDAELGTASLTVELFVDGVSKGTQTITGDRTRTLIPFPTGSIGNAWRAKITYSGTATIRVHSLQALWMPLEDA